MFTYLSLINKLIIINLIPFYFTYFNQFDLLLYFSSIAFNIFKYIFIYNENQ